MSDVAKEKVTRAVRASGRLLPRRQVGWWLIAAAVVTAVLLAILTGLVASKATWPAGTDSSIGAPIFAWAVAHDWSIDLAWVWHYLGASTYLAPITIAVVVVLMIFRRWGFAIYVAVCAIGGTIASETMKALVERPRPQYPDAVFGETGFSYTSGHSMAGICNWVVFGVVALYVFRRPFGTVIGWVLIVFGILMGPSRLIFGVHWTSDVVGGWLLGSTWVLLVTGVAILIATRGRGRPPQELPESERPPAAVAEG